jgi:hypothetical protein
MAIVANPSDDATRALRRSGPVASGSVRGQTELLLGAGPHRCDASKRRALRQREFQDWRAL